MAKHKKGNGSSSQKKGAAGNQSGENLRFIVGLVLLVFALYLLVVFVSYVMTGNADQDSLSPQPDDKPFAYENWAERLASDLVTTSYSMVLALVPFSSPWLLAPSAWHF